jgi:outer membrane protein assembly factor BamA
VVPFLDFGRVWDRIRDFGFSDYRWSYGIGGRISWNQATILRFDFARSTEADQFFFGFQHIF